MAGAGFFSALMGKNGTKPRKFKKADMGDAMTIYYNEELKMFVEKGKEQEAAQMAAPPPPPPRWSHKSDRNSVDSSKLVTPSSATGAWARYAALPGLTQPATTGSNSISSLTHIPRPRGDASLNGRVRPFVPDIAAAQAMTHKTDIAVEPVPNTLLESTESFKEDVPNQVKSHNGPCSMSDCPWSDVPQELDFQPAPQSDCMSGPNNCTGNRMASQTVVSNEGINRASPMLPHSDAKARNDPCVLDAEEMVPADALVSSSDGRSAEMIDGKTCCKHTSVDVDACTYTAASGALVGNGYDAQDVSHAKSMACAPPDGELPSPYVLYLYDDWPEKLWKSLLESDPEQYFFHFQQRHLGLGWVDEDWLAYKQQCPEFYEHLEYYNMEWASRGPPWWPLPHAGQPLREGGFVTQDWLTAHTVAAEAVSVTQPGPDGEHGSNAAPPIFEVLKPAPMVVEQVGREDMAGSSEGTIRSHLNSACHEPGDQSLSAKVRQHTGIKLQHLSQKGDNDQMHGPLLLRDAGCLAFKGRSQAEVSARDVEVLPDKEELKAMISQYLAPMRQESCAGSEDDNLYSLAVDDIAEVAGVEAFDVGCERTAPVLAQSILSDEEDGEDGYEDLGSMLAVASPSSCHRHAAEAAMRTGELSNAVAAADAVAAMRHLEVALDTAQGVVDTRTTPSLDNGYANSVHLSEVQSEAPSSMYVHAPDAADVIIEEADGGSAAAGLLDLPNIPEGSVDLADAFDDPVLPPMHGDVPSTTRPEINLTDLERRGMKVGRHSTSCVAEAASTENASKEGSEDTSQAGPSDGGGRQQVMLTDASGGSRSTVGGVARVRDYPTGLGRTIGRGSANESIQEAAIVGRLVEELSRMNGLMQAAVAGGYVTGDILEKLKLLHSQNHDMVDAIHGHKVLAAQLECPSASGQDVAVQRASLQDPQSTPVPLRLEHSEEATPIQTPGILSNLSTPEPQLDQNDSISGHSVPQPADTFMKVSSTTAVPLEVFHEASTPLHMSSSLPIDTACMDGIKNASALTIVMIERLQEDLAQHNVTIAELQKTLDSSAVENEELRDRLTEANIQKEVVAVQLQAALCSQVAAIAELERLQSENIEMQKLATDEHVSSLKVDTGNASTEQFTANLTPDQNEVVAVKDKQGVFIASRQDAVEVMAVSSRNDSETLGPEMAESVTGAAEVMAQLAAAEILVADLRKELYSAQERGASLAEQLEMVSADAAAAKAQAKDAKAARVDAEEEAAVLMEDLHESILAMGMEGERVQCLVGMLQTLGVDPSDALDRIEAEHTAVQDCCESPHHGKV